MIEKIIVEQKATFKNREELNPGEVNFFYGSNGTGKTTISNLLGEEESKINGTLVGNVEEDIIVYNKNFVETNFNDNSKIKGIYTFGNDANDAIEKIGKLKEENLATKQKLEQLDKSLSSKKEHIIEMENGLKESLWVIKTSYQTDFKNYFIGKSVKDKLMNHILYFYQTNAEEENVLDQESILKKYDSLYSGEAYKIEKISDFNFPINYDQIHDLLEKPVIGKDDLNISKLINRLNNASWIRDGKELIVNNEDRCPFCDTPISKKWLQEIEEYFDEEYELQKKTIANCKTNYETIFSSGKKLLDDLKAGCTIIGFELKELDALKEEFYSFMNNESKKIEEKCMKPETKIELISFEEITTSFKKTIDNANINIDKYNRMLDDIDSEKVNLEKEFWLFVINPYKEILANYFKECERDNKAKDGLDGQIKSLSEKNVERINEIKSLEATISGITNSVEKINALLESFGFRDFHLQETSDSKSYKIIREDGTDVGNTLSEGEYRFISFLYFYQLINGSINPAGMTRNKIIVIDDPISSLNSNILFIVSTLVRDLITKCLEKDSDISQMFLLTHNVYYHKEITYTSKKSKDYNYFIVKKKEGVSTIKKCETNPVETTYQLLWDELKPEEKKNKATVFNTMRRILEYYFNIIGEFNYEKAIHSMPSEEDKVICRALVSCINDNSHYISDDYNIIFDDETIQQYEEVFKLIFENLGHQAHYNMMMHVES